MSEAPKSAFELAMEKLKKQDVAAGVEAQVLTEAQRAAITEAKSVYDARVAERRILHQSAVLALFDPAEIAERETELQARSRAVRDRSRRQNQENPGRRVNRPGPTLLKAAGANSGVLEGRPLPFA